MPDPVADYLRSVKTPDAVKAQAWDAVHEAKDDKELTERLRRLPVPNEVRAQLFDLHPQTRTPATDDGFADWYAGMAKQHGLSPNPDDPQQFYDYRAAFKANASPDASGHWPSTFKKPGHPNMVVGGFNVQTGARVPGSPRAKDAAELVRLGWDQQTAAKLAATPEPGGQRSVLQRFSEDYAPGIHAETMSDPLKRVGIGADKGLGNTVLGAADIVSRVVPGLGGAHDDIAAARAANQPDGTAERLGYGAEQVGEFLMLPASKGGLLRKIAMEGGQSAALSTAQGGDPIVGALAGATGPLVNRGVQAAQPFMARAGEAIRESAEKRVAQALGATKERFKAMAEKLAPQMLDRGVPGAAGASRAGLLEQATAKASEFGKAIDGALQGAANEAVGIAPIVDALEEAKSGFQVARRMSIADAARQGLTAQARQAGPGMVDVMVTLDARPIQQLSQLQDTLRQLGDSATVEQIVAIRRVWDDVVARAGGFQHRSSAAFGVPLAEQTEAWAKREGTNAIRKVLADEQPQLAQLNREFAFWKNLQDVLTSTQKRTQAQQGGIGKTILTGAGATTGALTGDSAGDRAQKALIGAAAGRYLQGVVTSPRWRFVSANVRNQLADALVNGEPGPLMQALSRTMAATGGGGALRPMPSH
jgi:hypothetical protein